MSNTLVPFKKRVEYLEEKNNALAAEVAELKEKLAAFDGKLVIDEKEIDVADASCGGVPDEFGFGTSKPNSDGFGF